MNHWCAITSSIELIESKGCVYYSSKYITIIAHSNLALHGESSHIVQTSSVAVLPSP